MSDRQQLSPEAQPNCMEHSEINYKMEAYIIDGVRTPKEWQE